MLKPVKPITSGPKLIDLGKAWNLNIKNLNARFNYAVHFISKNELRSGPEAGGGGSLRYLGNAHIIKQGVSVSCACTVGSGSGSD